MAMAIDYSRTTIQSDSHVGRPLEIVDSAWISGGVYIRSDGAHLNAESIRKLLDRIEAKAAPAYSLQSHFDSLPIGARFRFTKNPAPHLPSGTRVKVSATHYAHDQYPGRKAPVVWPIAGAVDARRHLPALASRS